MMKNSTDSSNAECGWATEDVPNAKTLLENEPENQQRWKQMPKDSNHSTNTYTATRKEKVITTTSTDDSSKRKNLPPIAKSNMYKTKLCRNYMETGRCKYGRVCQFAHGMKELRKYSLCVCLDHVEQRQQCTLFLFRGHLIIVLLTGMTALTEDEDISEAIMLKPLPLVVRRASQSANTNTSNSAPFTLPTDILEFVVCPRAYLEDATIR